jgi:two-component system, response regulator PdtaR
MNVLIVEDEMLIALDLQAIVEGYGFTPIGPARTKNEALAYADQAEIALVDVNLADGRTGPDVAHILSDEFGVPTIFVTGNPEQVVDARTGAIGLVTKPHSAITVTEAIEYAVAAATGAFGVKPLHVQPLAVS